MISDTPRLGGRRGFVITIDAIAALSFMMISFYLIQSTSFNPVMLKGTQLKQISLDTMSVLEKSGGLNNLIELNDTTASEVLLSTPEQAWMELTITAINGTTYAMIEKPRCGGIGKESQVVYGGFRSGGVIFSSTLISWYNQGVTG
jgi:hypothetical protein